MIRIVGGFKQPIAKLPENEKKVGHPVPANCRNSELIKVKTSSKKGGKRR
jgi:hypothetical protein